MITKDTLFKNINLHFWILFNIAICAIMNDYAVYITGINYGISLGISVFIIIILNFFFIKKKSISIESDFEWFDLVFILMILMLALIRMAIPDVNYDTCNYHIYLQENIKIDKINFDFFAAKTINAFLFPLGDRINYIGRYLLGYRLGTVISYYSVIVIYYQSKKVLNHIIGKRRLNSLLAILCWSSFTIRILTGYYYIDTYSVAFTLGILNYILREKDCFIKQHKVYTLAILTGILIAIKLPNLFLVAPVFLIFLIIRRKQLKLKYLYIYLIAAIIFVIPFIIYIIDNIIQTGSPLYPYYNNIFKSEWFGYYLWEEPRFGIPNWKYKLIWPIYTSLSGDGYGDDFKIYDPIWAIGYITTILYIIFATINWHKRNKELYNISIISIVMTIMWIQFLHGYMRYALIIPVLYSIIIATIISKIINFIKRKYLLKVPNSIHTYFLLMLSIFIMWAFILYYCTGIDFKWVFSNYKYFLKDRKVSTIHIDGVWGVIGDESSLTQMLREKDVPIYNLQGDLYESSFKAKNRYNNILENNKNNIYVLIDNRELFWKINIIQEEGFYFEFIKSYSSDEVPYLDAGNELLLYRLNVK